MEIGVIFCCIPRKTEYVEQFYEYQETPKCYKINLVGLQEETFYIGSCSTEWGFHICFVATNLYGFGIFSIKL